MYKKKNMNPSTKTHPKYTHTHSHTHAHNRMPVQKCVGKRAIEIVIIVVVGENCCRCCFVSCSKLLFDEFAFTLNHLFIYLPNWVINLFFFGSFLVDNLFAFNAFLDFWLICNFVFSQSALFFIAVTFLGFLRRHLRKRLWTQRCHNAVLTVCPMCFSIQPCC